MIQSIPYRATDQYAVEVLPPHPLAQPDDGELPGPPVTVNLPVGESYWASGTGMYCHFMNWVANNQWMAVAVVVAGWYFLTREKR